MSAIQDSSQLIVTDFGPIQQADINLRPLSVFIGPSNTGKSYLAILIYALHCYFGSYQSRLFFRSDQEFRSLLNFVLPDGIGNLRDSLTAIGKQLTELEADDSGAQNEVVIPEPVAAVLRAMFREAAGAGLKDEIARCYGLDTKLLRRRDANGSSRVILRIRPVESAEPLEHHLILKSRKVTSRTTIPEGMPLKLRRGSARPMPSSLSWLYSPQLEFEDYLESDGSEVRIGRIQLLQFIADSLAVSVYGPFGRSAYYLPADRTGIMHAHKAVISAVLENAAMPGIRQVLNTPLLSGILADFLKGLIASDNASRSFPENMMRPKEILEICEKIEREMLGGSITIEDSEMLKYPQFSYQPKGWSDSLPLKNASSMVSELAPVLLYLRHQVDPGDVLIIEEPESHLHPSMQVQFTRQLAAIVNAGIRVIVTTHSEWILEELANLVRLSRLKKPDRVKIDGGNVALTRDKVGAWLFQQGQNSDGSTVSRIDLDESGLYPSGFDDVAITLHNTWARISNQLEK
ncbi:MAG: AAA family ATPase [Bacteroidetes bacterium]|nr:AAA family ATPase [Bacteroidota bacterium]